MVYPQAPVRMNLSQAEAKRHSETLPGGVTNAWRRKSSAPYAAPSPNWLRITSVCSYVASGVAAICLQRKVNRTGGKVHFVRGNRGWQGGSWPQTLREITGKVAIGACENAQANAAEGCRSPRHGGARVGSGKSRQSLERVKLAPLFVACDRSTPGTSAGPALEPGVQRPRARAHDEQKDCAHHH